MRGEPLHLCQQTHPPISYRGDACWACALVRRVRELEQPTRPLPPRDPVGALLAETVQRLSVTSTP